MRSRRLNALATLVLGPTLVAGCTGIPHQSRPSAIESLTLDPVEATRVAGPADGALPRDVLAGFLNANALAKPSSDGAYQFLTAQAQQHWDTTTVTVSDNLHIGLFDSSTNSVPVTGTLVGTIDRAGVYTPALTGTGSGAGGQPVQFTYAMKEVNGQWRIDNLRPGLLLDGPEFSSGYRQHALYFFDVAEKHLVPDPRWSAPRDPGVLAQTLVTGLANGPRDALQSAETTELPAINDPNSVIVTIGRDGLTVIEIPGASSLGEDNRDRLAAQIAQTLSQIVTIGRMEITDNHKPVVIPRVAGAIFDADQVTSPYVATVAQPGLYFVRAGQGGGVFYESGARLPGNVGRGLYGLDSVALANRPNTSSLLVAGTRENGTALDIGTLAQNGQMTAVKLPPGQLSRPDWVPGLREVWVGDNGSLYAIASPSGAATKIAVTTANGPASGKVSAVRLSPEGSRVALVLTNANQTAQLWIGAVLRGSGVLRVVNLTPISPQGVNVTDVAWNDELKLFAIGRYSGGGGGIFEVQADGSQWTADGIANLPAVPESITAAQGDVAAVALGGTIWQQNRTAWVSLKAAESGGSAPIYSN